MPASIAQLQTMAQHAIRRPMTPPSTQHPREDQGSTDADGTADARQVPVDSGGSCTVSATGAAGLLCGSTCIDPLTNPSNCGGCGVSVGRGNVCVAGKVRTGCPEGQSFCGGRCIDVSSDPSNCGGCGNATTGANICKATQRCEVVDGTPQCTCPIDPTDFVDDNLKAPALRRWRDCQPTGDDSDAPKCVDTWSDADHCGQCEGSACSGALGVCGRSTDNGEEITCRTQCPLDAPDQCGSDCVNFVDDPFHCGNCDTVCSPGEACVNGTCTCVGATAACDGKCVNFATDPGQLRWVRRRGRGGSIRLRGAAHLRGGRRTAPPVFARPTASSATVLASTR
jgi:hypothetical protein